MRILPLSFLLLLIFSGCTTSSEPSQKPVLNIPEMLLKFETIPSPKNDISLQYNATHQHYIYKVSSWQLLLFKKSELLTEFTFNLHFKYAPAPKRFQIYIDRFSIKLTHKNSYIDEAKLIKKYNTLFKEVKLQGVLSTTGITLDSMPPVIESNTLLRELTLWITDLINVIFLPLNGVSQLHYNHQSTRTLPLREEQEKISGLLFPVKNGILFDLKRPGGTIKGIFSPEKQGFQEIHLRYQFQEMRTHKEDTYHYRGENLFVIERLQ